MKKSLLFSFFLLTAFGLLADTDVTNTYIDNPNFEARFAGWDNNGFYYSTNSSFSRKNGMVYMERWVSSGGAIPNVEICQELYLPAGTYKLTAGCQNVQQAGNVEACTGAKLYANQESVTVTNSKDYDIVFTVLQGKTQIGFKVASTNANWASIDNVRLTLLDTDLSAEHAELQKLIEEAESVIGDGEGAAELLAAIDGARNLIESGGNEKIDSLAKSLSDATLNYRILNATGGGPRITTNKFVAAGATILLGRMTLNRTTGLLEKGFCWSTNPEPTIFDNRSTRYFTNNGEIYRMERLQPGTMYYVRPYALTNKYKLVYGDIIKVPTLPRGSVTADYDNHGSTQENYRIASAIEEILWLYNNLSSVTGINLSVHYGSDTPSADCSYGGWMRVGPNEAYQQTGTILHETNHGVGVGTSNIWWDGNYRENGDRGKWLGPRATQMIQFLNKDNNAYMTGDNTHMWPSSSYNGPNFGINGSWEDTYNPENTLLYYGNVLITHAMHQDGLICSSSVGFASPSYTFETEDDTKYYIKTTDEDCGNKTSFLYDSEEDGLMHNLASAATATTDDGFAWNIVYDPQTACYSLRNVGTGRFLSYSSQHFKVVRLNSPSSAERIVILPSRKKYTKGTLNTPSYWITINKVALKATSKTAIGSENFDHSDNNAKQHWLLLTEEQATTIDRYYAQQEMPLLDDILAEVRQSMQTPSLPISEDGNLEEIATPMNEMMQTIEAEKENYGVADIQNAVSELRTTFIDYLAEVKPASTSCPIPISWLIENHAFQQNSDGWQGAPESITGGVGQFSESTFNTYQTLPTSLPDGNYMLTLNAFQRTGTPENTYADWVDGKETVKAQLYAIGNGQTFAQTIQNIWSEASSEPKGGTCDMVSDLYIPNDLTAASAWFVEGCYQNSLTFELTQPASVKVGIRSTRSGSSWWTCFSGFGLQYYGPYDPNTGIKGIENDYWLMDDDCYDLNGRKLYLQPSGKGIFIHKGKKVLY